LVDLADALAPPDPRRPRYVFLDEVTAIVDDWIGQITWLRDQTSLRDDCVVLTGSSAERLNEARRDLAGRRGRALPTTRTLLPMGFRSFCAVTGLAIRDVPVVQPRDMLGREAGPAMQQLRFYLDELVARWEHYLQIGGFPRAVRDWIADREISRSFIEDLWDVIHADALADGDWTAAQSQALLESLARRLTSTINKTDVRRDLGEIHNETLVRRLRRLENAYVAWPCYRTRGNRPDLAAQEKMYLVDALQARLAHERRPDTVHAPDFTQLTEQQVGVALLRAREHDEPGTWTDFDGLMHYRSATRSEVDFVGPWLGRIPYEVKYTEGAWRRETQTALAAYGRVVLATRNVLERDENRVAVPAAILAFLLDPEVTAIPA
jgi:predicted AAA+ superfamily ATPase